MTGLQLASQAVVLLSRILLLQTSGKSSSMGHMKKSLLASSNRRGRFIPAICALGIALVGFSACAVEEDVGEIWIGNEKGALELVPDKTPSYLDEAEVFEVFGEDADDGVIIDSLTPDLDPRKAVWTVWYDRDNPTGNGDYENRIYQAGVCPTPSGVDCRTVGGLYLWDTEEIVTCSASVGLICVNADQPDDTCNYDYKVRFLCPETWCGDGVCNGGETYGSCPGDCPCTPNSCGPGQCGYVSNGCGGTMYCSCSCKWGFCSNDHNHCCASNNDCQNGGFCDLF